MKTITLNSLHKIIVVLCFFGLGNTYGQNKSTTSKTLFGKTIATENKNPNNGIIRCATVEYEQYLQEKNPKRMTNAQFEAWLAPLVNKQKAARTSSKTAAPTIITIPVVVHVIYNGQPIGTAPNITDAQVESQITVLNQDFRKMLGTAGGESTNPVAADIGIEFVLAKVDPNGNPTNGIDRVSMCQPSWSRTEIDETVKPATIWDPAQYMNMWSVEFSDASLLGYAQFPDASGLSGLAPSGGVANTDGVVSRYNVFGSNDFGSSFLLVASQYNKGRTMTHEVGHWLGLRHIWGDGGSRDTDTKDCDASDYCDDTPQAGWENYDCVTSDSCPLVAGNDMIENYMDYTNDTCMNIFTLNQKDRIMTVMANSPRRNSLKTSTKGTAISLYANDAEIKLEASCDTPICGALANQTIQKVLLYNRGSNNLTSATINYNINGSSNNVYNWTGSLATHKFAVISILINSATNGTFNASVSTANSVTDQRATNNSASGSFLIPIPAPNYTYTNYTFRLQQDLWGSETTWNLKDGSGAILFSGGPYADTKDSTTLPSLITENWTLTSNQCYTFTINDTEGDGLCCSGGNGYYDIKATDGTVISSGTSFKSSKTSTFTTGTLANEKFETSTDIYLYPNPTKGTLNIQFPSNFGLPDNYAISNALGQKIIQKEVSKETDLTINTAALSNGIYFITIVKDSLKRTLRFIKE
ncbi:M43 family zinc metalloprotease [Flavobacterium limnophilum]|uniref:M43 family zinc metalloprotease n=1 Tax=Flavobacterium limnophilum TaxID=3003262 RepID=UPI0024828296|nr:M43 family zinc metalloprotease [Flavobacterium limnophilum]